MLPECYAGKTFQNFLLHLRSKNKNKFGAFSNFLHKLTKGILTTDDELIIIIIDSCLQL